MGYFVRKNDTVTVEVYVYEVENDQIDATHDKSDVPQDKDVDTLTFIFRKPSHADSREIIKSAQLGTNDNIQLNVTEFQDKVLTSLIKDWDLKDDNGIKVACNTRNLDALEPRIARAAVAGILTKVQV